MAQPPAARAGPGRRPRHRDAMPGRLPGLASRLDAWLQAMGQTEAGCAGTTARCSRARLAPMSLGLLSRSSCKQKNVPMGETCQRLYVLGQCLVVVEDNTLHRPTRLVRSWTALFWDCLVMMKRGCPDPHTTCSWILTDFKVAWVGILGTYRHSLARQRPDTQSPPYYS